MVRWFNVKFAALFLANSVLCTLFLYAAKDEKNKAIFFIIWWTLRTNKKITISVQFCGHCAQKPVICPIN
jgi:hypothetical protein